MKARVIATGEIISLNEKSTVLDANPYNFNSYEISELEILYENTNFPKDYWEKLLHQYAGMAMQALLSSDTMMGILSRRDNGIMEEEVAREAFDYAHALVEKYKKEEK